MNNYCCQFMTNSGRILETFHEDFLEAVNKCMHRSELEGIKSAQVYHYPDMKNPIVVARIMR